MTSKLGNFVRRADIVSWRIAAYATALIIIDFAAREYNFYGILLSAIVLSCLAISSALITRMYVTALLLFSTCLLSISVADTLKQQFLKQLLGFNDFLIVRELGFLGFVQLTMTYVGDIPIKMKAIGLICAVLVMALISIEVIAVRRHRVPQPHILLRAVLCFIFLIPAVSYWRGNYLEAVASQNTPHRIISTDQVKLSQLVAGMKDYAALASELSSEAAPKPVGLPPGVCSDCPDIVVVHVESTFDPMITKEYERSPGLLDVLNQRITGENGLLRVNVWGGFSWVTEFEILCGVNHRVFGRSGNAPQLVLAPLMRNCMPSHLKSLGYETHVVYPTARAWLNVGAAFKKYGIDTMYDVNDLKLSNSVAWGVDDKPFIDKALEVLSKPRTAPRFIYVSTMWNHGPHGKPVLGEGHSGPFDLGRAADPKLKDYVNRLNSTTENLKRLESEIAKLPHPAGVMLYGDHQPSFALAFSSAIEKRYDVNAQFITFFRFMSNRHRFGSGHELKEERAEYLGRRMLSYFSLPKSQAIDNLSQLSASCGEIQQNCPLDEQAQMRRALTMQ